MLDLWAIIDPKKIMVKVKLHVLPHSIQDVQRHGPPVLYAVEVFECWNAVFRLCSVLSNHQAPSRDIAITTAGLERFKHIASRGHWKDKNGSWVQAGQHVRNFMLNNVNLQRRLHQEIRDFIIGYIATIALWESMELAFGTLWTSM